MEPQVVSQTTSPSAAKIFATTVANFHMLLLSFDVTDHTAKGNDMALPGKPTAWASFGMIQRNPGLGKRMAKLEKRLAKHAKRRAQFEQGDLVLDALGKPFSIHAKEMAAPADIGFDDGPQRVEGVEFLTYPVRIVARHGDFASLVVK